MSRNELILTGIIAVLVIAALSFWGYNGHQCKLEAIKAGLKGDEIRKSCM